MSWSLHEQHCATIAEQHVCHSMPCNVAFFTALASCQTAMVIHVQFKSGRDFSSLWSESSCTCTLRNVMLNRYGDLFVGPSKSHHWVDVASLQKDDYMSYTLYFPGRTGYNYCISDVNADKHR